MDPVFYWVLGVAFVLLCIYYGVQEWWKTRTADPAPPEPEAQPVNELARLVWAAHVAAQNHDLACLTGTAPQMFSTLGRLIDATEELSSYMETRLKETSDDKQN